MNQLGPATRRRQSIEQVWTSGWGAPRSPLCSSPPSVDCNVTRWRMVSMFRCGGCDDAGQLRDRRQEGVTSSLAHRENSKLPITTVCYLSPEHVKKT